MQFLINQYQANLRYSQLQPCDIDFQQLVSASSDSHKSEVDSGGNYVTCGEVEGMNEEAFIQFLKRKKRSANVIKRVVKYVRDYEQYLSKKNGEAIALATEDDLRSYVEWIERKPKTSAKTNLWALGHYFNYTSNKALVEASSLLRGERIERTPFELKKFRGVNSEYVRKLDSIGIRNVVQMLEMGKTHFSRLELSERTGIPLKSILEFVKLSDLARIPGVKEIRARLYYDAGIDTIEKMAEWDPDELRKLLVEFVDRTGFDGIAPLPAEVRSSVEKARKLPKIAEY